MNAPELCLHTGGTARVSRDTLRALPLPQPRSPRHRPVPHIELVEGIQDQLDRRGLTITREQLALRRDGQRLFGTMDLAWSAQALAATDEGLALGLRQGNDLSYAIEIVAGQRIFVCDNLALYGEVIAVRRKQTSGLRLPEELAAGIDRYLEYVGRLVDGIASLKAREIATAEAKRAIYDVFPADPAPPVLRPCRSGLLPARGRLDRLPAPDALGGPQRLHPGGPGAAHERPAPGDHAARAAVRPGTDPGADPEPRLDHGCALN